MSKEEQFLWLVQTAIIANCMHLTSSGEASTHYHHCYSANGALMIAGEAAQVSERIPPNLSAYEAAVQFCTFMLDNLKHDAEDARRGKRLEIPAWFGRPTSPDPAGLS